MKTLVTSTLISALILLATPALALGEREGKTFTSGHVSGGYRILEESAPPVMQVPPTG